MPCINYARHACHTVHYGPPAASHAMHYTIPCHTVHYRPPAAPSLADKLAKHISQLLIQKQSINQSIYDQFIRQLAFLPRNIASNIADIEGGSAMVIPVAGVGSAMASSKLTHTPQVNQIRTLSYRNQFNELPMLALAILVIGSCLN